MGPEAVIFARATPVPRQILTGPVGRTWSRRRRVIAKAEWTQDEANPRFVVTSLKPKAAGARHLYEQVYCARGEMENRIKECQTDMFADRTSTGTMRANQLRLWFASMSYVLLCALRRIGLPHTQFAEASCGTIRLKLLKGRWSASRSGGSSSPWPRAAPGSTNGRSSTPDCATPPPERRPRNPARNPRKPSLIRPRRSRG